MKAADDFSAISAAMKGQPLSTFAGLAGPDDNLIALCGEIVRLEQAIFVHGFATIQEEQAHYGAVEPLMEEHAELIEDVCDLPALTIEGFRARAKAICAHSPELLDNDMDVRGMMISALLRDLIGEALS